MHRNDSTQSIQRSGSKQSVQRSGSKQKQAPQPAELIDRIKALFFQFDKDRNGVLTKNELHKLMNLLQRGRFSKSDVDKVFFEMDVDCSDGVDIDEFVEWVMCPSSAIRVRESGPAEFFDVNSALRPLFQVYDRDRNGWISMEEFRNLYDILKGSIGIESGEDVLAQELGLRASAELAFREVDDNQDRKIDFEEFVHWMKDAVEHSCICKDRFVELVVKLAGLLQSLLPMTLRSANSENFMKIRKDLEGQVQDVCNELFDNEADPDKRPLTAEIRPWQDLPRSLSKQNLLVAHMRLEPVKTSRVEKVDIRVSPCFPHEKEKLKSLGIHKPRWLAKVERKVEFGKKKGKKGKTKTHQSSDEESRTYYYSYEEDGHGRFCWQNLENREEYESSYQSLEPELLVLAAIMTEADFSERWTWAQAQSGLQKATELGFVSAGQIAALAAAVKQECTANMIEKMDQFDELSRERQDQLIEHEFNTGSFEPFAIMRAFTRSGIVPDNPLWSKSEESS